MVFFYIPYYYLSLISFRKCYYSLKMSNCTKIKHKSKYLSPYSICFYSESQNMIQGLTLPMVIGVFVRVSAVVAIAVLFVISFTNRRFYSKLIRENAFYVGSVVSEHVTTTLCRVPEQHSDICDENIPTDNNTYMLAISLRYKNM